MLMFCRRFSAACIVHGISFIFYQMECLDGDDLTSLNDTSQCSKSCQLKVSMRNLIKHLNFFHLTLDLDLKKGKKKTFLLYFDHLLLVFIRCLCTVLIFLGLKFQLVFLEVILSFYIYLLNFNLNGSAYKHLCL
jgi:hypothetical protein